MAKYTHLIPQNIAPTTAEKITVYNPKGKLVGSIPLRGLAPSGMGEKLYSFGCLSDVHVTYETAADDFQRALTFFNETGVDFICICGDLAYSGTETELQQYKDIVDAHSGGLPVYVAAGNHEQYASTSSSYLEQYTGKPLYYTVESGDDVFIMFGVVGGVQGSLFDEGALQWLYETLEANRNKRCFLFEHILLDDGCGDVLDLYGYSKLTSDTTEGTVFKSLLAHYSNLIFFHGHSHMRFYLQEYGDKANYDNAYGCHSVHIPSCAVPRDVNAWGTGYDTYTAGSEGYVVDVYENGIHLRGRDFVKGEFLPIASYWLDTTLKEVDDGAYSDNTGTLNVKIPSDYQQVEWIGVSGTQWINTDISPQSDDVVYECEWLETSLESRAVVFGSTNTNYSAGQNRWSASHYHPGTGQLYSATGVTDQLCRIIAIIVANEKNTVQTVIQDGTITMTLNGETASGTYSGTIQNGVTIGLFANNRNTTPFEYAKYTQMYSWKMWDAGVLVRNMIPCYRKSDEVIGMYDTVSRQFFTNAGTGEFSKGDNIAVDNTTAILGKAVLGKAILGTR